MQDWIISVMEQYGYAGIFLMVALENLFPPIPSELVLPFGGFMTTQSSLTIPGVVAAATAGSVVGAAILYGVGLLLDVETLDRILAKWGRVLRVSSEDVHRADAWFDRYGPWAVLICRVIPLVRSMISIPAGMSNMRFVPFLLLTTIGTLAWNILLVITGAVLGDRWEEVTHLVDVYSTVVYVVVFLIVVAAAVWWFRRLRRRSGTR